MREGDAGDPGSTAKNPPRPETGRPSQREGDGERVGQSSREAGDGERKEDRAADVMIPVGEIRDEIRRLTGGKAYPSRSTVFRWMKSSKVQPYLKRRKACGVVFVWQSELIAFLHSRQSLEVCLEPPEESVFAEWPEEVQQQDRQAALESLGLADKTEGQRSQETGDRTEVVGWEDPRLGDPRRQSADACEVEGAVP
ncbi:MAG: hypothetical protein AAGD07_15330 [Planctomycetota bacterium]